MNEIQKKSKNQKNNEKKISKRRNSKKQIKETSKEYSPRRLKKKNCKRNVTRNRAEIEEKWKKKKKTSKPWTLKVALRPSDVLLVYLSLMKESVSLLPLSCHLSYQKHVCQLDDLYVSSWADHFWNRIVIDYRDFDYHIIHFSFLSQIIWRALFFHRILIEMRLLNE